jgi:tetratricopeptide (TPR) repeat protein
MKNSYLEKKIEILLNSFNSKLFDNVILKTKPLLKKFPEYIILYNLLGSSYQNIGKYSEAKDIFLLGLRFDHKNIALKNNLAMSYKNLLQYNEAEKLYNEIIKDHPAYINSYVNLGNIKRDANMFDEAIKLYEKANVIKPNEPIILYLLSLANQGLGDFKLAIEYGNKALKLNPKLTQIDHLISQSSKYETKNAHYKNMLDKLNNLYLNDIEKINIFFALSKIEEDLNDIKSSYEYLKKGNNLKKKILQYNIKEDVELLDKIIEIFKDVDFPEKGLNNDPQLIFILGLPRSGTSLVEQIITSHSKVYGGGELPILPNIIKNNIILDGKVLNSKAIDIIKNKSQLEKMSKAYLEYLAYFNFKEKFATDKAPLNFRWIGFIKLIFPNAKIIHCQREPKNNCLSLYKNFFEGGLNFTYDEQDIIEYHKAYTKLMKFWNSKKNHNIFNVSYEDLINNNDAKIREIINYCGLDWEENCLLFYKNKNPIKTMSTAQARKPIYKSSLNIFDRYKNYLKIIDNSF